MTDLHDPIDDLIRDAVHELVDAAPGPRPLPAITTDAPRSLRRLAVAAAVLLVGGGVTAAVLLAGDDPGAIVTEPDPTVDTTVATTVGTTVDAPGCPGGWVCVDAQVLGRDPDATASRIEIDRGEQDGVVVGLPVMNADGLVGTIVTTFPTTAVVRLMDDPDYVATSGSPGLVVETIRGRGSDRLPTVELDVGPAVSTTALAVGDTIASSGGPDAAFPAGIPIGRVVSVPDRNVVEIEPAADLDRLDRLSVVLGPIDRPATITSVPDDETGAAPPAPPWIDDGWREVTLPDASGAPSITTDGPQHLIELGSRRLIVGSTPYGCCFTSIDAWLDDGSGTWAPIQIGSALGVDPNGGSILGSGPVSFASGDGIAVAAGAEVTAPTEADPDPIARPAVWVTDDLVSWDEIVLPGLGRLTAVAPFHTGWIATGIVDEEQRIYHSPDGRTWTMTLGASGIAIAGGPDVFVAGPTVVVQYGDGSRVTSDSGLGWSEVDDPVDAVLLQAGRGVLGVGPAGPRLTIDGATWEPLAPLPDDLVGIVDPPPGTPVGAALTMDGDRERVALLVDRTWWLGDADGWSRSDLELPQTEWGPTEVKGMTVLTDGTLVVLGAVPVEPGNKPIGTATVWTHEPLGPPPPTTVVADLFGTSGTAEQQCTDAMRAIARPDEALGTVLEDRTTPIDGVDTRWLVCSDESAQYGVAVVVERAGVRRLAALGLGTLFHAGDDVDLAVDGDRTTVTYRSLVNESGNRTTATTVDGGRTWTVRRPLEP